MTLSADRRTGRERASHVRDARGRLVTQIDPVRLHVWHRYDVMDADVLHDIVEDLEPGTAKMRRRIIVIVPVTVLAIALGVAALYYFSDSAVRRDLLSTLTNPVIMVPNLVCCIIVPWMGARQARLTRVRFAMLKHRHCPHCGYDLRLLPVDPGDGVTVCPECGCAWVIDDAVLNERLSAAGGPSLRAGAQRKVLVAVVLLLCAAALGGFLMFTMM